MDNFVVLDKPKPKTWYNHYSNPVSQGALLHETAGFPNKYNNDTHECWSAYSDRIMEWNYENYQKACKLLGGGMSNPNTYKELKDQKLREFAKIALKLPTIPEHVRIIHYYNVSNGYSCPVILAIYPKT